MSKLTLKTLFRNVLISSKKLPINELPAGTFVSQPFAKIVFPNGFGFYVLNSYKVYYIPRFYGTIHRTYWEFGFKFLGLSFEIMWNKFFKIK